MDGVLRRSGSATTRPQRGRLSSTRSATARSRVVPTPLPPVAHAPDEEVDAGVVEAGGVVAGQRVQVGAVDLPVAHGCSVEDAEAGEGAAVPFELRPDMVGGDGCGPGELPEGGDGGVVHPAAEDGEIALQDHRDQVEDPGLGGRAGPGGRVPEQFAGGVAPTSRLVPVRRDEGEEFLGEFQVESVFRAGVRGGGFPVAGPGARFLRRRVGFGGRVGGRHGDTLLSGAGAGAPQAWSGLAMVT
ncbi:hypothetical protein SCYAM73S_04205 [Streptomyces cyaneofuscatus]